MKHDIHSDSFAEFIIPKMSLLLLGTVASVLAAASRFPKVSNATSERTELNPDRFGRGSKVYVLSCVVQIVVIQIWCLSIVHASFVTGERLRREPFLSTRPSQLAFRVSVASELHIVTISKIVPHIDCLSWIPMTSVMTAARYCRVYYYLVWVFAWCCSTFNRYIWPAMRGVILPTLPLEDMMTQLIQRLSYGLK